MRERTAVIAGERLIVKWTQSDTTVKATVNGRPYELTVRRVGAGGYWFGWQGNSSEAVVTESAQGYDVTVDGHRVHVEFFDSGRDLRRRGATAHSGIAEIRAPMPGKIVRVLAAAEEEVQERQGIVVMEAMKMQNEIRSPKGGRIVELRVAEGDAVGLGDLIARVE
jgi:biotin carboxyl carrier protein